MNSLFDDILTISQPWSQQMIAERRDMLPEKHGVSVEDFIVREYQRHDAHMDMRHVVGQTEHYAGQSWRDAALEPQYRPGKMRAAFAQCERNPDYYFNGELANGIKLGSIDGRKWFTDGGGNHRTVVARFACDRIARQTGRYPLVRGVSTCHYQPDLQAWQLFCQLRQRHAEAIFLSVTRVAIPGGNDIAWRLQFFVVDRRFGGIPRAAHLDTARFCAYARHVLAHGGQPSWRDRIQDWLIDDPDRLVYPSAA